MQYVQRQRWRSYRAYRGPACYSPNGYNLTPGCCISPPSACDNAWDGYCQEKAKWQAYFTPGRGTPRMFGPIRRKSALVRRHFNLSLNRNPSGQ